MPKRESLRRVLELSKQEYENKNKKSTETDESDNEEVSDEETDSKGKFCKKKNDFLKISRTKSDGSYRVEKD